MRRFDPGGVCGNRPAANSRFWEYHQACQVGQAAAGRPGTESLGALARLAGAGDDITAVRAYVESLAGWADLKHSDRVMLARLEKDVTDALDHLPGVLNKLTAGEPGHAIARSRYMPTGSGALLWSALVPQGHPGAPAPALMWRERASDG